MPDTPSDAPETGTEDTTQQSENTPAGTAWEEIFKDEDPAAVRKALDHAREWEKRAKANADAATKLAEIDEANKSETEKATERITALEAELAETKAAALRAQAAAEADIPLALITASTEDEIKAQVKTLKDWLGDKKPGGNRVPREGRQTNPPKADDKKAFADFLTGQG
jgi:membrane protein involved in colicin uptake